MWDKTNGGFYWALDSDGNPAPSGGAHKHAYGMAFAIRALANAYTATGDEQLLTLAQEADRWLETRGHDKRRGGYFQAFTPKGEIIASVDQTSMRLTRTDKIGAPYGYKSADTHVHLMEAFVELHRASPNPELRDRIGEMYDVTRDLIVLPTGTLGRTFIPTWTPLDRGGSFGHDIEAADLLLDAAKVLKIDQDPKSLGLARKLVDRALETGWDNQLGGFWSESHGE